MSQVTDETFDHAYDGIQEYDNPLPRWWVWLFIFTIIWSILYLPYYHFGPGKLPEQAYEEDMEAYLEAHPPVELASAEELAGLADDEAMLAAGKPIFETRCASCHAPDGGGLVGPNLTDDYTIHGQSMAAIVSTIYNGVPEKGMIAWKDQIALDDIYAVAAYVHGLRGTTPANPKEPQGEKIDD